MENMTVRRLQRCESCKKFIEDAKVDEKKIVMYIRQIAQESTAKTLAPVEIRYYLRHTLRRLTLLRIAVS